ncbi:hypothetical protein KKR91_01360 [Arthrobacter jiangjiafuii]|uniref:Uncharacterized protein n=1 Tax=Arthrobacter jiangjiafuii TaxID=2817475 RepID=A0A975M5M3_9MICC|nr:hypothetical protein [Arthrobacter jiangjiafuii]MBP3044844.1 hypothetical protein [Arthrobacter jiangjiafuii]QWC10332.1 hypothetical protein KKR91_01360 [Arthrobacter jiangjiafuii]
MIAVENLEAGMMILLEGRKKAVEVLMVDNHANPNRYQIGHYGKGFAVTGMEAGTLVQLVG